jgi:hypothetical protein
MLARPVVVLARGRGGGGCWRHCPWIHRRRAFAAPRRCAGSPSGDSHEPHDQLDGISGERRSPGSMGIAPAAADESTMPAKDRLWRDEERRPPLPWHQPGQDCDQCPVRPRELGPSYLTAKDSQLLAEHQDLRVLGDGVHATDPYELDQVADQAVEEAERHRAGASPDPWCLVKPRAGLLGPFRCLPRLESVATDCPAGLTGARHPMTP